MASMPGLRGSWAASHVRGAAAARLALYGQVRDGPLRSRVGGTLAPHAQLGGDLLIGQALLVQAEGAGVLLGLGGRARAARRARASWPPSRTAAQGYRS